MVKRSLHPDAPFRFRAPSIFTSSAVRSPEPWNQQTSKSPLGRFDDARSVMVPMFERENEFGFAKRLFGGGREGGKAGAVTAQRRGGVWNSIYHAIEVMRGEYPETVES